MASIRSNQQELSQSLVGDLQSRFQQDLDQVIDLINLSIPKDDIYVLKTHGSFSTRIKNVIEAGDAKAIVTYRNPLDIAVSIKEAAEAEFLKDKTEQREWFTQIKTHEDALARIPDILNIAKTWLDYSETYHVPFSRIVSQPTSVIEEIAHYLSLTINSKALFKPYSLKEKPIFEFNKGIEGRGEDIKNVAKEHYTWEAIDDFLKRYFMAQ